MGGRIIREEVDAGILRSGPPDKCHPILEAILCFDIRHMQPLLQRDAEVVKQCDQRAEAKGRNLEAVLVKPFSGRHRTCVLTAEPAAAQCPTPIFLAIERQPRNSEVRPEFCEQPRKCRDAPTSRWLSLPLRPRQPHASDLPWRRALQF